MKQILLFLLILTLSSCGLTQKLLCQGSMEPNEYNSIFYRDKCDSIVNENALNWYKR